MKQLLKYLFNHLLAWIEKAGNRLPHPATLFLLFAISVPVLSGLAAWLNWAALHPVTGELIQAENLLTRNGLHRMLTEMVTNFTGFAPLGVVVVAMLGIGVAEDSGLIGALIRKLVLSAPKRLITFTLVFAGILSNVAADIGYVLLIPLAGMVFIAFGRHPIVGMTAAFAGVSGGFSANLALGTIDPLLAGISEEAAHILEPGYQVNPTANYYFMVVSTFFIALAGTLITDRVTEPRYSQSQARYSAESLEGLSNQEKKALRITGWVFLAMVALLIGGLLPQQGLLRGENGGLLSSPVLKGIVALIFAFGFICGIVYGVVLGKFRNDFDIVKGMEVAMRQLGVYLVLVFFAAQFIAFFKWSNLGVIFAIRGAEWLSGLDVNMYLLLIAFIILSGTINLFIGSASAKWALLAPVFIPLFMLMGYSPELSQVVYRIGDSVTNIISPMMSFFALIIAFYQKYDKKAGMGTIISMMLPYTLGFFIIWSLLLVVWIKLGLPLGPGVSLNYPAG